MEQDRDRLKHLLIILLETLSASVSSHSGRRRLIQDKVAAAGLDEEDVNGLLDWIEGHWDLRPLPNLDRGRLPDAPSTDAVRVFVDFEREIVTPRALAYLVKLQTSGQIDRTELEALLNYAAYIGVGPLETEDLETVIEQVLFRPGRPGMTGGASEGQEHLH
ncbi:hypothetical protein DRQ50_13485 [bacterium]|nr:MAG: hypothetical protein DRQ50_13485 [bacterium]